MPTFAGPDRIHVGDVRVTFLADGGGVTDPNVAWPDSTPEAWVHHRRHLDHDGKFVTSVGGFLVETADRRVVVDTGIGDTRVDFPGVGYFQGGRFLDSLATTGVSPEEVTDVIYTHLHLDHCGWTTRDGSLTFPNARHLVAAGEWEHWHGGDDPAGPDPVRVQQALEGHLDHVADGETIAPGIDVVFTPGHTPGHLSLVVSSGTQRLLILGDAMHCALQMSEPQWNIAFDMDPEMARATRARLLEELERPDTLGAACHFASGLTFGRVLVGEGTRYWGIN